MSAWRTSPEPKSFLQQVLSRFHNDALKTSNGRGSGSTQTSENRVLVLFTGGTIGMMRNEKGVYAPVPNALGKTMRLSPQMHDEEYSKKRFGMHNENSPLVLPDVREKSRVIYSIFEYNPLLDSSNMTMEDWMKIAHDIEVSYELFDGFVILQGTDTMSYTASALSFMCEHLGKPIIITGSQIPMFECRSDGRENVLGALIIAGNYVIPEVCIFFDNKLMRGNRTTKVSTDTFDAFQSPNLPPLVKMGINIEVDYRAIFRPLTIEKFTVHSSLNLNVGLLRLFPSINTATVRGFLQPPIEGVVLETYGAGNVPSNRQDLLDAFKEATARGVIVVNCTQCLKGTVVALYETGQMLADCGVVPGLDMTPEAALTKLSYVLSKKEWSLETRRQKMQECLRGELREPHCNGKSGIDIVDCVANSLQVSSVEDLASLARVLYPSLLAAAVMEGNVRRLDELRSKGAELSLPDASYRTPLHVACMEGKVDAVRYLLLNGASIHAKDRFDRTPLIDAIESDRQDVIRLLVRGGAHIHWGEDRLGEALVGAATCNNIRRLECFYMANANMNAADLDRRTALHAAALHGHADCVESLLQMQVNQNAVDMLGFTPLDLAERMEHIDVIALTRE